MRKYHIIYAYFKGIDGKKNLVSLQRAKSEVFRAGNFAGANSF